LPDDFLQFQAHVMPEFMQNKGQPCLLLDHAHMGLGVKEARPCPIEILHAAVSNLPGEKVNTARYQRRRIALNEPRNLFVLKVGCARRSRVKALCRASVACHRAQRSSPWAATSRMPAYITAGWLCLARNIATSCARRVVRKRPVTRAASCFRGLARVPRTPASSSARSGICVSAYSWASVTRAAAFPGSSSGTCGLVLPVDAPASLQAENSFARSGWRGLGGKAFGGEGPLSQPDRRGRRMGVLGSTRSRPDLTETRALGFIARRIEPPYLSVYLGNG
jgi:hypothetical protein